MNNRNSLLLLVIVALLSGSLVYFIMHNNNRSPIAEAAENLADGVKDATRSLNPNPTPAEKAGRAVEDLGEKIQDSAR